MGGWRRQEKGAGAGGRGRGGKGGATQRARRGKGEAGEADSPAGAERRPHWAPGSRRLLTIPGRRAVGRLLLPLSQALGPWGSHARSGCRPAFPAAPPRCCRRPASGREGGPSLASLGSPSAGAAASPRATGPSSHSRGRARPTRVSAALAHILRGAATGSYRRRAASRPPRRAEGPPRSASLPGGGFAARRRGLAARPRLASPPSELPSPRRGSARRPGPPAAPRRAGPRPRGPRFRAPGAAWPGGGVAVPALLRPLTRAIGTRYPEMKWPHLTQPCGKAATIRILLPGVWMICSNKRGLDPAVGQSQPLVFQPLGRAKPP